MSDNGLNELTLAAVALGDAAATDRWYRSEFPKVFRLCFGFTAGSDAEDVVWFPLQKIPGLKLWSETERIINLAVEMKAALAAVDD